MIKLSSKTEDMEQKLDLIEDKQHNPTVPYSVFEGSVNRAENREKRLCKIIALLAISVIVSNGFWFYSIKTIV